MSQPISLASRVVANTLSAHVVAAGFLGDAPAFACADGSVSLQGAEQIEARPHRDGLIVAAFAKEGLLTGGEDGRVVRTRADGSSEVLADEKGKWIDAIAAGPDGAVAWSAGRNVSARSAKGEVKGFSAPSTARGLAFLPKGYRLAVSHYNGASLWFPNASAEPDPLPWKGSHLDATVSPDGRYVVTSMQENALHGWRLTDKAHMRMTGYPAKTRSMSWSHDGAWLATSGAEAAIIWPFSGKDGRWARPARMRRAAGAREPRRLPSGQPRARHRLRGRLRDAGEADRRLRAAGAHVERSRGLGARLGRGRPAAGDRRRGGYAGLLTLP